MLSLEGIFGIGFFILGTIVASFIGVVVARFRTGASIVYGRSRCDACGSTLSGLELVPIISWFVSGGRCRSCKSRVSAFSTISEIILGALFVLSYITLGIGVPLGLFCGALSLVLAIVLYDLAHTVIPSAFLYPFIFIAACFAWSMTRDMTSGYLVLGGACAMAGFLFLLHFGSKGRAMGFADAPLAFGLALLVGPHAFAGFIFSFWIGAVVGVGILLAHPRGTRMGIEVPFAPFLVAGFLLAYFTAWDPFVLIATLLF